MKSIFLRILLIPAIVFYLLSFLFYVRYVKNGPVLIQDFLFLLAGAAAVLALLSFWLTYRTTTHIMQPLRTLVRQLQGSIPESGRPAGAFPEDRPAIPSSRDIPGPINLSGIYEINEIQRQTQIYLHRMKGQLEDLNLERELLRSLLNGLRDGVICIDQTGSILFINESVDDSLMDSASQSKRYYSRIRHPLLLDYVNRLLTDVRSDAEGMTRNADAPLLSAEDLEFRSGERYFRARNRLVRGGPEQLLFLVIVEDVTEEYSTRRLREDFLQNASHELKTPITSIRGYAETLLPRAGDDMQKRFLEGILRNAERMDRLIYDMVVISSLESRAYPFMPERIDLASFCEELRLLIDGTLSQKEQQIEIHLAPSLGRFSGDRLLLEHLFINLISNASRYSPEQSLITITLSPAERNRLEIRIADRGPGIPEEYREKIFERFFRLDQDRSRKEGGTGLGLSIVRHVVRLHSGSIRAEAAPGGGACFVVLLPFQ